MKQIRFEQGSLFMEVGEIAELEQLLIPSFWRKRNDFLGRTDAWDLFLRLVNGDRTKHQPLKPDPLEPGRR